MLKKVKWLLAIVVVAALVLNWQLPEKGQATSSELEQINKQIKELQAQKRAAEQNAKQARLKQQEIESNKAEVKNSINWINSQIEATGKKVTELKTQIAENELKLADAEAKMAEAEERLTERDAKLRSRLRLMYTNGNVSYMEVLFNSTSFADFLDRYNSLQSLVGQDKELLEANKRDLALIQQHKAEMETLLANLTNDYETLQAQEQYLRDQERERQVQIASLNQEAEEIEGVREEEEQAAVQLAKLEAQLIAKKNRLESNYKGGALGYPLPKVFTITSRFGSRVDPITGKRGAQHNGMDFGAPTGTDILSAESGTVITAGWVNGYGNTVVVSHGDIWTWYAHQSRISVSVGDVVKKGQKVGEVGSTGRSTGPHLHFGVYSSKSDKWLDPAKYLNL